MSYSRFVIIEEAYDSNGNCVSCWFCFVLFHSLYIHKFVCLNLYNECDVLSQDMVSFGAQIYAKLYNNEWMPHAFQKFSAIGATTLKLNNQKRVMAKNENSYGRAPRKWLYIE